MIVKINCKVCGKEKEYSSYKVKKGLAKYCSLKCFYVSRKEIPNPNAGNRVPRTEKWKETVGNKLRGKKRPLNTIRPMYEAMKKYRLENPEKYKKIAIENLPKIKYGAEHPCWKGGITAKLRGIRFDYKYKKWRKDVINRYNGKCSICNSENKIEAHHIVSIIECESAAFVNANGVALCNKCHKETESYACRRNKLEIGEICNRLIVIKVIPQQWQIFTTLGNWFETDDGTLIILITKMSDWRYEAAVLAHELIEYWICKHNNITTKVCDDFDALFEEEYKQGKWAKNVEAGFDKRCPYRKGHIWGARFERLVIWLLGAKWKDYLKACEL